MCGTSERVLVRFLLTWCAPRLCQEQGALAAAKLPTRGIPAGDQLAMRILGIILGSWRSLFVSIFPLARTCVYANDGSLADRCMTSASPTPDQLLRAQQPVFDVLMVTCDMFGDHVFIKETSKQIRLLNLHESCERLGLCASQVSTTSPRPASLRDGWKPFLLVVAGLATILGPMANSQWSGCYMHCTEGSRGWAVYLPAAALFGCSAYAGHYEVGSKMRRSARFWADGITGCSTIATSVQALRGALCLARTRSVGLCLTPRRSRTPSGLASARHY